MVRFRSRRRGIRPDGPGLQSGHGRISAEHPDVVVANGRVHPRADRKLHRRHVFQLYPADGPEPAEAVPLTVLPAAGRRRGPRNPT